MKIEDIEIHDENRGHSNDFGETPLMTACAAGNYDEVLDLLLKSEYDQTEVNHHGRNALMRAAGNGHFRTTKLLLDVASKNQVLSAVVFAKDKKGKTALDWARLAHNHKVANLIETSMQDVLIKFRAEKKEAERSFNLTRIIQENYHRRQILELALQQNDIESVRSICNPLSAANIQFDSDENVLNYHELQHLYFRTNIEDADIPLAGKLSREIFYCAIKEFQDKMPETDDPHVDFNSKAVYKDHTVYFADHESKQGFTALLAAAGRNDGDLIYGLIRQAGANPDHESAALRQTPLTYAALSGSTIAVAALINNGVSLNTQTTYERRTALMLAAEHLHIQVVAQLLDYALTLALRDEAQESLREYDSLINVVGHELASSIRYSSTGKVPGVGWHTHMKQAIHDLRDYDGRGARDFAIVHTNSKVESEAKRAKIIVDMIENAIDRVKKRFHKLEEMKRLSTLVKCPQGCNQWVRVDQLEKHKVVKCKKRVLTCNLCNNKMPAMEITPHQKNTCTHRLVRCRNHCGKEVECHLREAHEKHHCKKRVVLCRLGCGERLFYDARAVHEVDKCSERFIQCESCKAHMKAKEHNIHVYQLCPKRIVYCGRGCEMRMPEDTREDHEANHCILRPLPCKYAHLGCCEVLAPPDHREIHEKHLCPKRTIECKLGCGHSCLAELMPLHLKEDCPHRICKCRNGCGREMMFKELESHERRGETGMCSKRYVRCRRDWIGNRILAHRIVEQTGNTRKIWDVGVIKQFEQTDSHGNDFSGHGRLHVRFKDQSLWLNVGAPYNFQSIKTVKGDKWDCGWIRADERVEHENKSCRYCIVTCSLNCGQKMPEHTREKHEKLQCPYRKVKCDLKCGEMIPLKELSDHRAEFCPERIIECPDCEQPLKAKDLSDHQIESCQYIRERCPNGCGLLIRRDHMEIHLSSLCLKRVVRCKWKCGREMFADASDDHETKRCQLRESKCTHGCGEMIPYHNIKNHWEKECIKRPIACVQCKNLIVAEEMALHMNVECPRRLYLCFVGCGKKVAVEDRLKHERDECMYRPVACSLGCGRIVRADRCEDHIKNHCRRRIIDCPHGCDDIVRAEELEDHYLRCGMRSITCGAGSKHCMRQQRNWVKTCLAEPGRFELVKCDVHQSTGLHKACAIGGPALVEIMLSNLKAGEIDYEEPLGTTPLTVAAFNGHAQICRILIYSGASINKVTKRGRFPLLEAVKENNFDAVKVLLEEGANMYLKNRFKVSSFQVAKRLNLTKILDYMNEIERLRTEHRQLFVAISTDNWSEIKRLVSGGEPHQVGHIQLLQNEKPQRLKEAIENTRAAAVFKQQVENMRKRYEECKEVVLEDQLKLKQIDENLMMLSEERLRWDRDAVLAMDGVSAVFRNIQAFDVAQVLALGPDPPSSVQALFKGLCLLRNVKPGKKRFLSSNPENSNNGINAVDDWVGPAYALFTDRSFLRFLRRFDPEVAANMDEKVMHELRDIVLEFPSLEDDLSDLGQEYKLLNAISVWIHTALFLVRKENCENILHEGEIEILKLQEEIGDHLTPYLMQYNFLGKEADSMELEYQAKKQEAEKAQKRHDAIDRAIWVSKLLDYKSDSRHTALTWAAIRRPPSTEICQLLLENGASLNNSSAKQEILTAKVIQLVFRFKYWLKTRGAWTPARAHSFRIREFGHQFQLKAALRLIRDETRTTRNVLAEAYFNGNHEVAALLLERGAKAWKKVFILPSGPHPLPYPSPNLEDFPAVKPLRANMRFVHACVLEKPISIVDCAKLGFSMFGYQKYKEELAGFDLLENSPHNTSIQKAEYLILKRLEEIEEAENLRQKRIEIRERADLEQRVGKIKLSEAMHSYNFEEVIRLVDEESIAIDMPSLENYTALGLAASEGTLATNSEGQRVLAVELLLDRPPGKIRPAIDRESDGMTALMWASNNGRADVVESLIKRGANVNYASKDPCPAHIVPPRSSFDCTTEAAAAMIRAEEDRWKEKYILRKKSKMSLQSNILVDPDGTDVEEDLQQYGKTSLIMATCNNKLNVAWLLVQHGANLDAVDSTGRTALDWAAILGRHDILQMLTQARINFFGDARGKGIPPSFKGCSFGCGKRLPIKLLEKHEAEECPKRPVRCPQNCFIEELWAEEVEDHLLVCANRPTKCILGCGAEMGLLSMKEHTTKFCERRIVECPLACGKDNLEWRHIDIHCKQWCVERALKCSYVGCDQTIAAKHMREHKKSCEYRLVRCRNGCGLNLPWNERRKHERTECPERWVKCRWHTNGCDGCLAKKQDEHQRNECKYREHSCACGKNIQERHYRQHLKEDCPKRMVNCRTKACNARFPFCDRELHEKHECAYRLVRCAHIYVPSTTEFDDSELNPENGEDIMIRKRSISRNVSKLEESETIIRKKQKIPKDAVSVHHMKDGGTEEKKVRIKGCGELVRLSNMEEHWKNECTKRPVPCGKGCGKTILLCNSSDHKKDRCSKRQVMCSLGCYKLMLAEDLKYHETWQCKQRNVFCSLGCGLQISEIKRKLHERNDCPLRFLMCPNGCRETMRFEDLEFHLKEQCSHRQYRPPKTDWTCKRCTMRNLKRKCIDMYGDDVFTWKCLVCKANYAKKGVKVTDILRQKYS